MNSGFQACPDDFVKLQFSRRKEAHKYMEITPQLYTEVLWYVLCSEQVLTTQILLYLDENYHSKRDICLFFHTGKDCSILGLSLLL